MTSNELPHYPSFAMRTKTGPLQENRGDENDPHRHHDEEAVSQIVHPEQGAPEVTDPDQHVLPVNGNEPSRDAAGLHRTEPVAADDGKQAHHLATPVDTSTASLHQAGEGHARQSHISAAGSLPFSKPGWPSKLKRSNSVTVDTLPASMNARQSDTTFKETLSAFTHAGGETDTVTETVTLSGKNYSSLKSEKSRKRKADEKKGSKKDPKKREKGKTNRIYSTVTDIALYEYTWAPHTNSRFYIVKSDMRLINSGNIHIKKRYAVYVYAWVNLSVRARI
jgi:hypothetical protein